MIAVVYGPSGWKGDVVRNGEDCMLRRFVEGAGRSAPGLGGVARFTWFSLVMLHFSKGPRSGSQHRVHLPGFGQENTDHSRQFLLVNFNFHPEL